MSFPQSKIYSRLRLQSVNEFAMPMKNVVCHPGFCRIVQMLSDCMVDDVLGSILSPRNLLNGSSKETIKPK